MRVRGKVLESGVHESKPGSSYAYKFAYARVLDRSIGELVEVTQDLTRGQANPFDGIRQGTAIDVECYGVRIYKGMLTAAISTRPTNAEGALSQEADESDFAGESA